MSVRDDFADTISLTLSTASRHGVCRRHHHHGHHHHYRHRRTSSASSTASGCRRSSPPRVYVERCCSALDDEVERYFYVKSRRASGGGAAAVTYGSHGSLSRLTRCNSMRRRRSHTSIVAPTTEKQQLTVQARSFRAISPKPLSDGGARLLLTPSKLTVEAASSRCSSAIKCSSSDTSELLPDYVYAPSPIKWNFPSDVEKMSDRTSSSESVKSIDSQVGCKKQPDVKTVSIWRTENDEANAIIFHHESEIVENCCRPPSCNDIELYSDTEYKCDSEKLNNCIASHPPPTRIEIPHRNSFPSINHSLYRISSDLRRFQKTSNFNHNTNNFNITSSGKLSNCEPSTSRILVEQAANNLTDIFSRSLEQAFLGSGNERDTKFTNNITSYATLPHCTDLLFRASPPLSHTAAVHTLARCYDKSSANISLTNQNRFTSYFNADRRQSINVLLPATDADATQHSPTSSHEAILDDQHHAALNHFRAWGLNQTGFPGIVRVVRRRAKKFRDLFKRNHIN